MFSYFEFLIAWRYLRSKRSEGGVTTMTWISLIGISLSVFALIATLSVRSGFRTELVNKIVGFNAHITIKPYSEKIEINDNKKQLLEKFSSEFILSNSGEAIIIKNDISKGILLRGYNNKDFSKLKIVKDEKFIGDKDNLAKNHISIGKELSFILDLKIGDNITLLSSSGVETIIGNLPRQKTFKVTSLYESGLIDFDSNIAFINLNTLEEFFNLNSSERNLEIYFKNPQNIEKQKNSVQKIFPTEFVYSWSDMNKSLFSALKVERNVMFIILSLIIIVAAFNIISGLTILVKNKTRDIAILKSIGVLNKSIIKIFFLVGFFIGTTATIFGIILGVVFSLYVENLRQLLSTIFNISLFPEEIYFLSSMPSEINLYSILIISFCSILVTVVVSIFPAFRAAKIDPIKSLKYE